jgi:hypothetical protein
MEDVAAAAAVDGYLNGAAKIDPLPPGIDQRVINGAS